MQLRVPKQYRRRRRRGILRLLFGGWLFKLILLAGLIFAGYWLLNNPDQASEGVTNAANNISNEVSSINQQYFPEEPTSTPDVRGEIAECENAYLTGELERVIEVCSVAIQGRPNDLRLHMRLAHTLIITSDLGVNEERLEQAVEVGEMAINANPEAPEGWAITAMALDWAQEWNKALSYAERATEIDSQSTFTKAVLINIYRNLGQIDRANIALESALEDINEGKVDDPFIIAQVYRNWGRLEVAQARFENAIDPYERAIETMPDHTYMAVEMASQVYYPLGQYTFAISLLEDVRASYPRDASVLFWLSVSYSNQGELDERSQLLTICVDANPRYVPCLSALGQGQFWEQNYVQAINNLSSATEYGSTNPYDWYLLARSYYNLSNCADAIAPLREGYRLITEEGIESAQVDQSNFVNAARDCNTSL